MACKEMVCRPLYIASLTLDSRDASFLIYIYIYIYTHTHTQLGVLGHTLCPIRVFSDLPRLPSA
jgi:hypothetical protein